MLCDAHRSRVEPTVAAVSAVDSPSATRNTRISRCASQLVEQAAQLADSSARSACCSGSSETSSTSGIPSSGSQLVRLDASVRVDHLVRGDTVHERQERLPLEPVPGQARNTARHTSCATSSADGDRFGGPSRARQ